MKTQSVTTVAINNTNLQCFQSQNTRDTLVIFQQKKGLDLLQQKLAMKGDQIQVTFIMDLMFPLLGLGKFKMDFAPNFISFNLLFS